MMNAPHPADITHGKVVHDTQTGARKHSLLPGLVMDTKMNSAKAHGIGSGRLEGHAVQTVPPSYYGTLVGKTVGKPPATKTKPTAFGANIYPGASF